MEELHRQRPQPLVEVRVQVVDGQLVGLVAERVLELARHLQRKQRTRQRSSDSVAISAELPVQHVNNDCHCAAAIWQGGCLNRTSLSVV